MLKLLSEKSFEKISVNEICEISNFPRATFYNYFDDKYDLLNYCWYVIAQEIQVDQAPEAVSNKSLIIYFDRLYDVFKSHAQLLNNILQYNDFSGQLGNSFINYFKNKMQEIFTTSIDYSKLGLPVELVADHCSETVILVLKWIFWNTKLLIKRWPMNIWKSCLILMNSFETWTWSQMLNDYIVTCSKQIWPCFSWKMSFGKQHLL